MTVRRRAAAGSIALLICVVCVATLAKADQTYRVEGSDTYQIGSSDVRSEIAYAGTQQLSVRQAGKARRYIAHAEYLRNDQGTHERLNASFESTILPNGEQEDGANN